MDKIKIKNKNLGQGADFWLHVDKYSYLNIDNFNCF